MNGFDQLAQLINEQMHDEQGHHHIINGDKTITLALSAEQQDLVYRLYDNGIDVLKLDEKCIHTLYDPFADSKHQLHP
ncbi:hypothetical protein C0159_08355 [Moraxella catarrhalis]|uniref:hypothetical protein n=1 Tax=Moraxella catarrhalis TaxID=480 RepID=UPI0006673168|nr:hypothetical protein [Moraxella catarrhalis]MPW51023.1 hypothetical protein [Moraxella catarrhalis]MPW55990.1 hypothetical protein [Moraxella catarrhalis]MPW59689.1 hypothetical protein [Moraxella catarrhalis]MPW63138.1 hypothetical protein [Moraxella catarrhalis]MPW87896.1 hypothetical protein [Moraxella catarrhalis]